MRILLSLCLLLVFSARAQMVEVTEKGEEDKSKAQKYFEKHKGSSAPSRSPAAAEGGSSAHYLALHIGTYLDDQAYRWGNGNQHKIGDVNIGVTYRLGEWINSADFLIRSEYSAYSLDEGGARK